VESSSVTRPPRAGSALSPDLRQFAEAATAAQQAFEKEGLLPASGSAQAHPEAERFEIWSQDEARVGQKGRTGYVWLQRGHTPRGLRDIGYQPAWITGAVCPARDTGVALVMTRLDTAAMNLFLAELGQAVAPGAHGIVPMDKGPALSGC
jgi:hypothetical protein